VTRLTEALARAGAVDNDAAAKSVEPDDPSTVVPGSWRFEGEEPSASFGSSVVTPAAFERMKAVSDDAQKARDAADAIDQACASLPAIGTLVVGPKPNNTLVEQFRHLAAALHHAQLKNGARTVMVASAVEAEGKTTTAANLALTLSESHQRRVLLIDADLRRPSVHTLFQLNNRHGLSDTLRDVAPNAPVPLHRFSPNLSIITAGRPTQDPMSALVSDMMKQFIEEATGQYDWVVIDTPPVALLSDANLLAAMIDVAVLVVGASATPYPLVRRAVEALGPSKILGVVLNRAKRSELAAGYGYYGYGYGYSYGDAKQPKKRWTLPFRKKR
jgi:protein-tyrosine kinase